MSSEQVLNVNTIPIFLCKVTSYFCLTLPNQLIFLLERKGNLNNPKHVSEILENMAFLSAFMLG
jgi:hypothetical protein